MSGGKQNYEKVSLAGMAVHLFTWNYIDSNAYVLTKGDTALVVDPVDTKEFWRFMDDKNIRAAEVVLTHEHFDHISGLNMLRKKVDCVVYAHELCSVNIGNVVRNLSRSAEALAQFNEKIGASGIIVEPFVCAPVDKSFGTQYSFFWEGHKVELTHTPGHSAGSMCMVLDSRILFSGDTLLEVPVITRLPGGDKRKFREVTLPWLEKRLEEVEWILPGHGEVWKRTALVSKKECIKN